MTGPLSSPAVLPLTKHRMQDIRHTPATKPVAVAGAHRLRRRAAGAMMRLCFNPAAAIHHKPLPRQGIHRILICHSNRALGNALLLTPLIQALETTWPGAEIDIITRSPVGHALYGRYDRVNTIIQLPSRGLAHPGKWLSHIRAMRKVHYDLAIDPETQSQTGRLLTLKARATRTLGFIGPSKSGQMTHAVAIPEHLPHKGQRPVYLLRTALHQDSCTSYPRLDMGLSQNELAQGKRLLTHVISPHACNKVIGIFANASGPKQKGKQWWLPMLARLEQLRPAYRLIEIIPISGQSLLELRYASFFSTNVRQLGSVLANLDACISLDCGVMHLACAAKVPTVGIFTTTQPEEWQPYGPGNHTVVAHHLTPTAVAEALADFL